MDEKQFQMLLKVFNDTQQKLIESVTQQVKETVKGDAPKDSNSAFSNIVPFENFETKKEKFVCYVERFENYAAMKNVNSADKKAQLLCVSIGPTHYNGLAALLGPDKSIKKLSYDNLVDAFKQMLVPKKNVVVSQHYFLNIYQKEKQTIAEFVATLQRDLAECEFFVTCDCQDRKKVSVAEIFLRAQFVRGLRDSWLREQLLQSGVTSFDEILTKATALEASRIESKELTQPATAHPQISISGEVNKVTKPNLRSRFDQSSQPEQGRRREFSQRSSSRDNRYQRPSNRGQQFRSRSRGRNSRIDFRSLGIEGLCLLCGKNNHKSRECRVQRHELKCNSCGKEGHVERVCMRTLISSRPERAEKPQNSTKAVSNVSYFSPEPTYGIKKIEHIPECTRSIVNLHSVASDGDRYMATVYLNSQPQCFEVDSGAKFSLIGEREFSALNLNIQLQPVNTAFRSYTGHIFEPIGKAEVTVNYKDRQFVGELYVVPDRYQPLLGRAWIRPLGMELREVDADMQIGQESSVVCTVGTIDDIVTDFPTTFEQKIGTVPQHVVKHRARSNTKPVFTRERNVPYALRDAVDKELDKLEDSGIIQPITASDWGSPLVVVPKKNGGIRLCIDYKCGVNDRLVAVNHPIRRIDDVLHSLRNSRYFCKLDLFNAYLHIPVDEESSKIQTISTHRGTYRMLRLAQGVKTAPAEFNRILSQILKGLPKAEAYFDDILVHCTTYEECEQNLRACLQRLTEYDLHVNRSKCFFFETKVEYLGFVVEYNKINKSPRKIQAVMDMPRPTNADEVRRFLGMITYYSKFIPDFSSVSFPLRRLLKKGQRFFWSSYCESTFIKLKSEICSDRVLMPFNPELPVILTSDASPHGIAAILSHKVDGQERPIAYASRSLSQAEQNYSQLDREALAIIFAVTHFYDYLFGRHFILVTDNQPLTRIFHHQKALPQMTSSRLLRYASFLAGFNYSVQFKKGQDNQNVDCLSRAPVNQSHTSADVSIGDEVHDLHINSICQISSEFVTAENISKETAQDPKLGPELHSLLNESKESPYTVTDGILFKNDRVVIPQSLQSKILQELHFTHLGMSKMKQLARRYVYWKGIDSDIEKLVKACESCAMVKGNPPKAPVHPWDEPQQNWERVHIDYAGPFENHHFLICVDARSKWAEVKVCRQAPTTLSTVELLSEIFATHGFPQILVSDNASIFTSSEFQMYCKQNGIFQKLIAPGHPATNGLAERNVQTIKQKLRASSEEATPICQKVLNILFRYRATPLACGKSPAELYLGRQLRIQLDAVFPYHPKATTTVATPARSFIVGERVQVRVHPNNKDSWAFGNVQRKLGERHYLIALDDGGIVKRHINQMRSSLVPKKRVNFGPTQSFNVPRLRPRPEDPPRAQPRRLFRTPAAPSTPIR